MFHCSEFDAVVSGLGLFGAAFAQDGVFQTRSLTPETALVAAKAALESCRKQGYQVAVAVVDRAGLTQVLLRDRFAGAHTVEVSANKAWTAASFRTPTTAVAAETQAGKPMSGLRNLPRFLAAGGGLVSISIRSAPAGCAWSAGRNGSRPTTTTSRRTASARCAVARRRTDGLTMSIRRKRSRQ